MLRQIKKLIPHDSPLRLGFHACTGWLAACVYGFPARKMTCIGITGTDGKTTTTFLTADLLRAEGYVVGMATTVGFRIGDDYWPNKTHKTTMGRMGLQRLLRDMVRAGCTHAVLEVSSHGLMQSRLAGVPFSVAVITNLSREHLDYHGTMQKYKEAKGKLFAGVARRKRGAAVIYADFADAAYYEAFPIKKKILYGFANGALAGREGGVSATITKVDTSGQDFLIDDGKANTYPVHTRLAGDFNVLNVLAALGAAMSVGVLLENLVKHIPELRSVPGRMEEVRSADGKRVFIDYAVTPDALTKLYGTLRTMTSGRVIAVLGACGDRDQGKRPEMGRIASQMTDHVILTDEEPYTEDPKAIIDMLVNGAKKAGRMNYEVIESRRDAIRAAIAMATPDDLVVVSGMGDQTSRIVGTMKEPWSDREEIEKVLHTAL